jgi:hypothetical protein
MLRGPQLEVYRTPYEDCAALFKLSIMDAPITTSKKKSQNMRSCEFSARWTPQFQKIGVKGWNTCWLCQYDEFFFDDGRRRQRPTASTPRGDLELPGAQRPFLPHFWTWQPTFKSSICWSHHIWFQSLTILPHKAFYKALECWIRYPIKVRALPFA